MSDLSSQPKLDSLPIDEEELINRYEQLYTASVYDVLMMEHKTFGVLPASLRPLSDGMMVCGTAFTVKGMPDCRTPEEKKRTESNRY